MNNFFKKKKNVWSLIGIVACIVLAVVFGSTSGEGHIAELNAWGIIARFLTAISISVILSLVGYMIFSKQGFWAVFIPFTIFIILQIVLEICLKKSPATGAIIISLASAIFLMYFFIKCYISNKIKINGIDKTKIIKVDNEEKTIEQLEKEIEQEDKKFIEEIKLYEKSFLALSTFGSIFQIIKDDNYYYFHKAGNLFKSEKNYIKEFDNLDEIISQNEKDFKVSVLEISDLHAKFRTPSNVNGLGSFGTLTFMLNGKQQRYDIACETTAEQLSSFWGEKITIEEAKQKKKVEVEEETPEEATNSEKQILNKLNLALLIISLTSTVLYDIYFFFNNVYINPYLTALCILSTIAPLVLYVIFNKHLSLLEGKATKKKLSVFVHSFTFSVILILKVLFKADYIVSYDYLKLILISFIVFVVLYLIIAFLTKEHKKSKTIFSMLAFILFFLSPGAVASLNTAFDFNKPQEIVSLVVDKPTHTNKNDEPTYYLTVEYDEKKHKTEVDEEIYNKYEKNSEIILVVYKGAFGIETVLLKDYT